MGRPAALNPRSRLGVVHTVGAVVSSTEPPPRVGGVDEDRVERTETALAGARLRFRT